jgi:hypothetical protein
MATLAVKMDVPHAVSVFIDEDTLTVELDDGRTISEDNRGQVLYTLLLTHQSI